MNFVPFIPLALMIADDNNRRNSNNNMNNDTHVFNYTRQSGWHKIPIIYKDHTDEQLLREYCHYTFGWSMKDDIQVQYYVREKNKCCIIL